MTYQDFIVIFVSSRVPKSCTFAHMKKLSLWGFILLFSTAGFTQSVIRKALFFGNSYTYVNDLSGLIAGLLNGLIKNLKMEKLFFGRESCDCNMT